MFPIRMSARQLTRSRFDEMKGPSGPLLRALEQASIAITAQNFANQSNSKYNQSQPDPDAPRKSSLPPRPIQTGT